LWSGLEEASVIEVWTALLRWGVKGGRSADLWRGKCTFTTGEIWALFLGKNPLEAGGESGEKES
jgi:hypothetical protein